MLLELIKIRITQIANKLLTWFTRFPLSVSTLVLVPVVAYLLVYLFLPEEFYTLKFNPNIMEQIRSIGLLSIMTGRYVIPISAVGYLFFLRYNYQVFNKYKVYPVSFYDVTKSNLLLLMTLMYSLITMLLLCVGSLNKSSLLGTLVFSLLMSLIIISSTFILFGLFWGVTCIFLRIFKPLNLRLPVLSFVISITIGIILLSAINTIPLALGYDTSVMVILLLLVIIAPFLIRVKKVDTQKIVYEVSITFMEKPIFYFKDIDHKKNYVSLLLNNRFVYLQFIVGIVLFMIFIIYSKIYSATSIQNYSLILVMVLTFNGALMLYQPWFDLRKKRVFQNMLI